MCCLHKTESKTKVQSIKKKQDFKRVYSQGKCVTDSLFVAYALANDLRQNRIGITVSKKIGCAVVRNRVKRRVKESYRQLKCIKGRQASACNNSGYDFVIIARAPSGQLKGKGVYSQIDMSIRSLLERVGKKVGFSL